MEKEKARQIKFRAWDAKVNCFHYWQADKNIHNDVFWDMARKEEMPITQFTGLKDKNGVEIFEGDILEFDKEIWYGGLDSTDKPNFYFVVEFLENEGWSGAGVNSEWKDYCEIVGNIHENPELI